MADILNQQGHRTWQNKPFNLKKVAWIRAAFRLESRYGRLRKQGLLTAKEVSAALEISETTVHEWARSGLLHRIVYDSRNRSLYEPLRDVTIIKGHGGRGAAQPALAVVESGQGAI